MFEVTYRHIVWKCIICHAAKFSKEAVGCGLALHGINVEMIQHCKSKCRCRLVQTGWEKAVTKELHLVILDIRTVAPAYTVSKYPQTVNNYQGILRTFFNLLLRNFLPVFRAKTCLGVELNILPDIISLYYTWATLAPMTKVQNKPKFIQG